ncbi:MAG: gamma carbonic anhydrase family protein [Planctomycetes bacterium]|nr:gamma carbonic anhydrase family protein [Planctomycetota bacterium]
MRQPHLLRLGDAYAADDATVVGDVTLGRETNIWYGAVIRGDVAAISIGARTNIQDLTVVHPQHDEDVFVGEDCVVGHGVMLHCREVGDGCLIGMGSILLPGARVGPQCLVAAGALVPVGMQVPARKVVMGSPARVVRDVRDEELVAFGAVVQRYLKLVQEHLLES